MKNIVHLYDLPTYTPPGHSQTTNRRLLGPGIGGSQRFEVVFGQIEPGGQAYAHAHPNNEQAFFVLKGKAEVEIEGEVQIVGPADFIFIPPGKRHRVTSLAGSSLQVLIIYSPPLASLSERK